MKSNQRFGTISHDKIENSLETGGYGGMGP